MRPTLLFACAALWLGAVAPAAAGDFDYEVHFPSKKASLGALGGKVRALPGPGQAPLWVLQPSAGTTEVMAHVDEKLPARYLAYDPKAEGKDKGAVFMARKGTEWKVERVKGERPAAYTIKAASGAVKGWYLDVAEEAEPAQQKGKKGTAYRVFLTEKPKMIPKWSLTNIGS